ncbi:MAG: hypothetical protein WC205_09200 [Opitutaceae bacterium]|jgi:hypothetical protein
MISIASLPRHPFGRSFVSISSRRLALLSAVLGFMLVLSPAVATASDGVWNIDAAGNWADTANWQGGTIASGIDASATFGSSTSTHIVSLGGGSYTLGSLNIDSSNQWNFQNGFLTLQTTTGTPTITAAKGY